MSLSSRETVFFEHPTIRDVARDVNYKAVLADLRAKRKKLDDLIAGLELFAGGDITDSPQTGSPPHSSSTTHTGDVRPDTFFFLCERFDGPTPP